LSNKILIFAAHQDDETIGCGGTIAKWSREGKEVEVCFMTDGGTGIEQGCDIGIKSSIIDVRLREASLACEILGVSRIHTLGIPCQEVVNNKETFHMVIKKIREVKPGVVLTHNQICKHRDHKNTSKIVEEAVWKSAENILEDLGDPHIITKLLSFEILDPFPNPDFVVDITDSYEYKEAAMDVYMSQMGIIPGIEIYLDGISKVRGYSIGPNKRGEAFKRIGNLPFEI